MDWVTWIIMCIFFIAFFWLAYRMGKAKQLEEIRKQWIKIEARRIAAKQAGERDYDKTPGK